MATSKTALRIAIAKDVLAHLKLYRPAKGAYIHLDIMTDIPDYNESAQKHIDSLSKNCEVCALGACMLSYVRLKNKAKVEELVDDYTGLMDKIYKVFPTKTLSGIEAAFEKWMGDTDDEEYNKATQRFGRRFKNDRNRLKAIMENVVRNKGEFKP